MLFFELVFWILGFIGAMGAYLIIAMGVIIFGLLIGIFKKKK